MKLRRRTFLFIFSLFLNTNNAAARPVAKSIYGNDDRYEVDQYPDKSIAQLSQATAGQVPTSALISDGKGGINFDLRSIGSKMQLCPEERFVEESNIARCSGFLVAPDVLVTAGHCISSLEDCADNSWVFGYDQNSKKLSEQQVYRCKAVIKQNKVSNAVFTSDYAVIRLDRAVTGVKPLEIRTQGRIKKGQSVVVIGHPSGLPTKITDGNVANWNILEKITFPFAFIRRANYFTANVDTFGGNSGSAVINSQTHEVEGILISGSVDYEVDQYRGCRYSARYSNNDNFVFEKILKIRVVKKLIKTLL